MIYKNKYLSESFLSNKSILKVSEEKPLVILLSKRFTFLNDFVVYSLKVNKVKFEIRETDEEQIMNYHLPCIAFSNYFLSQEALIQFIADLMLQRQSFVDLNERRNLIKDQYKKWFQVIKEEHTGLCRYTSLSNLGIHNQQDYFNHLFSQLFSIASWIKSDILERKYESFKRNQINLQTLFVHDIIKSILSFCGRTKVDHILRAHFENLIEFQEDFKAKIEAVVNQHEQSNEQNQIQIVTDKVPQQKEPVEHPKFRLNWKRFVIAFSIATGIYVKWVE